MQQIKNIGASQYRRTTGELVQPGASFWVEEKELGIIKSTGAIGPRLELIAALRSNGVALAVDMAQAAERSSVAVAEPAGVAVAEAKPRKPQARGKNGSKKKNPRN